jgi:hypothetical protein
MLEANLFQVFTSRLNESGITYMTTGPVVAIIYGQPRITHDIDLVDELHSEQVPQLLARLPPEEFYCPPEEVIRIMTQVGNIQAENHDPTYWCSGVRQWR